MAETFQKIIASVMAAYEKNPNVDIDAFIKEKAVEYGLSDELKKTLDQTLKLIDKFDEKSRQLRSYKEETGRSTSSWLEKDLRTTLEKNGVTDQEKQDQSIENLSQAIENIKDMCYRYYESEMVLKYNMIEDVVNRLIPFEDRRLLEINKLIDEFIKERDRIVEIDKMCDSND